MEKDILLYKRFVSGDDEAFDEIIETYRTGLTFFIDRIVRDTLVAEDISVDVFTYVLTHPTSYNRRASLKTYLYMLGRSRALDHLRRQKRTHVLTLDKISDLADRQSLEQTVLKNEENRKLYTALEALPSEMQNAVYLVYFEELSYKETAHVLKITPKKVDNLLYRAKEKLRELLEQGE